LLTSLLDDFPRDWASTSVRFIIRGGMAQNVSFGTGVTLAVLQHCLGERTFVQASGTIDLDPLQTLQVLY
jgi:hypothetical protein